MPRDFRSDFVEPAVRGLDPMTAQKVGIALDCAIAFGCLAALDGEAGFTHTDSAQVSLLYKENVRRLTVAANAAAAMDLLPEPSSPIDEMMQHLPAIMRLAHGDKPTRLERLTVAITEHWPVTQDPLRYASPEEVVKMAVRLEAALKLAEMPASNGARPD